MASKRRPWVYCVKFGPNLSRGVGTGLAPKNSQKAALSQRNRATRYVIACRILIQNKQLEQVDTFPYLGFLITEDGECTTEFRTRLNRGPAIRASVQKIWKSHSIPISTKIRLIKALVWPVALNNGCESWTFRNNKKTRLDTNRDERAEILLVDSKETK